MSSIIRKTVTAAVAALALGSAMVATSTSADAGWRGRGGWGVPVAAGVIGGLALGAIAAQAAQPRYYDAPAYYPVAEPQAYCYVDRRPAYNAYGDFIGWRPVRVCN
ncbi:MULTISPECIES: hypothetical protein [unclassified Beijerinckia]|uniref:hypothetical protein n=1 Tax=unclassified Beijerinckia TaxID=2638183 RepID=UPI000895EB29|nr:MULTISPECIES: hypothetical protein [unclassified Beijerinckia]MDH7798129.1 hypothetical protein [Beijerinckia sp. GAS462]SED10081.1 hypothetical protein SAMN05443249_4422 [Beijerinckia sp. 28-YEA-48]